MVHFGVSCSENDPRKINIEWVTASETSNDYFTVLKSTDGQHFDELFRVKGAGDSKKKHIYETSTLFDPVESPTVYYMLKQTDYDGGYSYSNLVAFEGCRKELLVKVLNNGSEEKDIIVYIDGDGKSVCSLTLFDVAGRLIESKKDIPAEHNYIHFPELAAGMYLLQVSSAEKSYVQKVIVRH